MRYFALFLLAVILAAPAELVAQRNSRTNRVARLRAARQKKIAARKKKNNQQNKVIEARLARLPAVPWELKATIELKKVFPGDTSPPPAEAKPKDPSSMLTPLGVSPGGNIVALRYEKAIRGGRKVGPGYMWHEHKGDVYFWDTTKKKVVFKTNTGPERFPPGLGVDVLWFGNGRGVAINAKDTGVVTFYRASDGHMLAHHTLKRSGVIGFTKTKLVAGGRALFVGSHNYVWLIEVPQVPADDYESAGRGKNRFQTSINSTGQSKPVFFTGGNDAITSADVLASGAVFVTGHSSGAIWLRDWKGQKRLVGTRPDDAIGATGDVHLSPNGRLIAARWGDSTAVFTNTGGQVLESKKTMLSGFTWKGDLVGYSDKFNKQIIVWPASGREMHYQPPAPFAHLAISPDGQWAYEREFAYRTADWRLVNFPEMGVHGFSSDGKYVVTRKIGIHADTGIQVWSTAPTRSSSPSRTRTPRTAARMR